MDPDKTPLVPNPYGEPPNFNAGPNLDSTFLAPGIIAGSLCLFALALRFSVTLKFSNKWFTDDWLCLITTVFGLANWTIVYLLAGEGMAKHKWDIPLSAVTPRVLKLATAHEVLGMMGLFAAKVLIAAFFIRVFGSLRWIRITCWVLCTLAFIAFGSYTIVYLVYCVPYNGEKWDNDLIINKCAQPRKVSSIATYAFSVAADVVLFIMPFPVIAKLTLSRQKKRGLVVVFFFGFMIVATSAVGLLFRIMGQLEINTRADSWMRSNITITTYTETLGTVLVSCAPAIFSFWINIVAKSRLYCKLRGREPPPAMTSRGYNLSNVVHSKSGGRIGGHSAGPIGLSHSPASSTKVLIDKGQPPYPGRNM